MQASLGWRHSWDGDICGIKAFWDRSISGMGAFLRWRHLWNGGIPGMKVCVCWRHDWDGDIHWSEGRTGIDLMWTSMDRFSVPSSNNIVRLFFIPIRLFSIMIFPFCITYLLSWLAHPLSCPSSITVRSLSLLTFQHWWSVIRHSLFILITVRPSQSQSSHPS